MMKKLFIILFFCLAGNVFAEESGPEWESSIKARFGVLHLPWEGPFVRVLRDKVYAQTSNDSGKDDYTVQNIYDETANQKMFGGGIQTEHFYKKHLLGENLPIEFGFASYFTQYEHKTKWKSFTGKPGTLALWEKSHLPAGKDIVLERVGWTYIDGINSDRGTSAIFLPFETIQIRVKRKVKDYGFDFMARYTVPLKTGNLHFKAGPSFFQMSQYTEMNSSAPEDTITLPDGTLDHAYSITEEEIDAEYFGIKFQAQLDYPLDNFSIKGFTIKSNVVLGLYNLSAKYEGEQFTNAVNLENATANRNLSDNKNVFSYTSKVELGLQYDTGFGLLGFTGEGQYLSRTPLVKYVSHGAGVFKSQYAPASLTFGDAYSFGGSIEYKYLF